MELPTQREKKGRGYGTSQTERKKGKKTERELKPGPPVVLAGTVMGSYCVSGRWGTEDLVTGNDL